MGSLFIYLFIYLSIANARMRRLVCAFVFCKPPQHYIAMGFLCFTVSAKTSLRICTVSP